MNTHFKNFELKQDALPTIERLSVNVSYSESFVSRNLINWDYGFRDLISRYFNAKLRISNPDVNCSSSGIQTLAILHVNCIFDGFRVGCKAEVKLS